VVAIVLDVEGCDTVVDSCDTVVDSCDTVVGGCDTVVESSINAKAASVTGEDGKSSGGRPGGNGKVADDVFDVFDEIPIKS
jgi:hypothetical protein